jgi:hypothetical protein
LAVVGLQEVVGIAVGDFELGALGMTFWFTALCAGDVPGVTVEAAALPDPAASMADSVRAAIFGEIITGELPSPDPATPRAAKRAMRSRLFCSALE